MSLLSFLGSLIPTRLFADNTHTNQTDELDEDVAIMDQSDRFALFRRLPAELCHMIIEEALYEHEKEIRRVVLLDPLTFRISPTKELAAVASPVLLVNKDFRSRALKFYTKVDVIDLGAPEEDQYGHESDWYIVPMNREYLLHYREICDQMEDETEDQGVQKGCLYINPDRDVYITGAIPRQVALTSALRSIPGVPDQPWKVPRDFITEPLQGDACAKITTMRELEWDLDSRCIGCGTCLLCGRMGRPCCTDDFFDARGSEWLPMHSQDVFTSVETFGFYLLTAGNDMEQFLHNLTVMGGRDCLEQWEENYLEFDLGRLDE